MAFEFFCYVCPLGTLAKSNDAVVCFKMLPTKATQLTLMLNYYFAMESIADSAFASFTCIRLKSKHRADTGVNSFFFPSPLALGVSMLSPLVPVDPKRGRFAGSSTIPSSMIRGPFFKDPILLRLTFCCLLLGVSSPGCSRFGDSSSLVALGEESMLLRIGPTSFNVSVVVSCGLASVCDCLRFGDRNNPIKFFCGVSIVSSSCAPSDLAAARGGVVTCVFWADVSVDAIAAMRRAWIAVFSEDVTAWPATERVFMPFLSVGGDSSEASDGIELPILSERIGCLSAAGEPCFRKA